MLKVANSVISASRITGVLPVANGGTGVTTSTGTGNTVLSATPTLSGDVTLSTGNLVIGTDGKGIDFSITSHPAGMTSELLADYEEGTFTPTIVGTTTSGTGTYNANSGAYTKIGNRVFFSLLINQTNHTGTGDIQVTGLPYTAANVTANNSPISMRINSLTLTALNYPQAMINQGAVTINLEQYPVGGTASSAIPMDVAFFIAISGQYYV